MKAHYSNNKSKGPGHGFLIINDAKDIPGMEGATFVIKRASDQKNLGHSGWQPAETYLSPDSVSLADDDGFSLAVGPEVVNRLDPQETYRLTLRFADGSSRSGSMQVKEVAYSVIEGGQGIAAASAEPSPKAPPEPEPLPEPEPEPEPAPMPEALPEPPPAPKRSPLIPVLLLILLLAAGAFAVWKFILNDEEAPLTASSNATTQANATEAASRPAANATAQAPQSNATAQSGQPQTPERKAPLVRARTQLEGTADPAANLALAKEFMQEADGADAAFLLAEDAAQKNNAEGMLLTARFYDPTDASPSGSIVKDPEQALNWYKKAQSAGQTDAAARLAALKAWVEAEAAKGNQTAKELLNKF